MMEEKDLNDDVSNLLRPFLSECPRPNYFCPSFFLTTFVGLCNRRFTHTKLKCHRYVMFMFWPGNIVSAPHYSCEDLVKTTQRDHAIQYKAQLTEKIFSITTFRYKGHIYSTFCFIYLLSLLEILIQWDSLSLVFSP